MRSNHLSKTKVRIFVDCATFGGSSRKLLLGENAGSGENYLIRDWLECLYFSINFHISYKASVNQTHIIVVSDAAVQQTDVVPVPELLGYTER